MELRTERERIAHLLRRFGLGASEAEMDYYGQDGLKGAIQKLLEYEKVEEQEIPGPEAFSGKNGGIKPQSLRAWWTQRILTTKRPLVEKMTLFWHDHFATSVAKVDNALLMYGQNETLRANATGNFRTLLSEVSKDPAMMFWLDNQLNVAGKPNENFGREVMELFTLGVGNYTEKDVQEVARAFTGWNYTQRRTRKANENTIRGGRPVFVFDESKHDAGVKTILGKTGNFNGDDVLDLLCDHPQTARYITQKMWTWFAYPDPDTGLIDGLASKFKASGLDIAVLLRAIMEAPEFYSAKAGRTVYKNPIDFTIATLRQLGANGPIETDADGAIKVGAVRQIAVTNQATKAMGMEILSPPDVAGWEGGQAWISSATMVERIRWADRIFAAPQPPAAPKARRVATVNFPAAKLFDSGDPVDVARKLCSVFDAYLPEAKIQAVAEAVRAASGGMVTAQNANASAYAGSRLIFGSPEFQFC